MMQNMDLQLLDLDKAQYSRRMQEEFFSTNQTHLLEINREVDKVIS
jgi:hypothetical protein